MKFLALCFLAGFFMTPATTPDAVALKVLYIGSKETPRSRGFAEFLKEHFAEVLVAHREGFEPAAAAHSDVVLLDWSQRDVDITRMAQLESPLGARDRWRKPTVLLGSAGLLIASPWNTTGAYG